MFLKSKINFLLCSLLVLNFSLLYAPPKQELKGKARALPFKKTKAAKEQEEEEFLAEVSREVSLAAQKDKDILQFKELLEAIGLNNVSKVRDFVGQNSRLVFMQNQQGVPVLTLAVQMNNNDVVRALLDAGADPNSQSKYGNTALMFAVSKKSLDIVRMLLDNGANPNLENKGNKETALMFAVNYGSKDIVQMLLDKGANPNIQSAKDDTALMLASFNGRADVARMLLDKGADSDLQNQENVTALIISAAEGNADVVRMLLENGANPDLATKNDGKTALMMAEERSKNNVGYPDGIVKMLKAAKLEQQNKKYLLQKSYKNWQGLTKVKALERNKIQKEKDEQQIREQILHEEMRLAQDLFAQEEEGFVNLDPISKLRRELPKVTNWADDWTEEDERRMMSYKE